MKKITMILMLLSASSFAGPEVLEGLYLGKMPRCGVEVTFDSDDALNFQILDRSGEEELNETVPFSSLKESLSSGSFEYTKEFFGNSGKVKVTVKGKVKRSRLKAVEIKKVYSFFHYDVSRCDDLTTIF